MQVKSVNVIDKYFVFLDIFMSASEELKTGDSLFLQLPHQISNPPLHWYPQIVGVSQDIIHSLITVK